VKFMQQKGGFNYYTSEELQAHVVELPYEGDHVSMVVILPPWLDDGLQQTVKRLTPETLQVQSVFGLPSNNQKYLIL
jgi:serine protease inhibitor